MAYRNTFQADALQLVAKKLQSSLAVEGELPEDGLAAYGDDGSFESVFAQAQQVAADPEALLVDAEWAAPEPVTAEVVAVGVGTNDRRNDGPEPQRSLFCWAEFMAERSDGPRRQRRDEAPTLSLFEWALEQEREGVVVGAKR